MAGWTQDEWEQLKADNKVADRMGTSITIFGNDALARIEGIK